MNSLTAADEACITYRQLDHWIRQGYIKGSLPGSGRARSIPGAEVAVLQFMAILVHHGLTPAAAAPLARQLTNGHSPYLGPWRLRQLSDEEIQDQLQAMEEAS